MSTVISARRTILSESIPDPHAESEALSPPWLAVVAEKVRGMQFGTVQITVHDAKVVQIERTERTRFEGPWPSACARRPGRAGWRATSG